VYLHLGGDILVKTEEVVGIFDLDTTTVSKRSRETLAMAEKGGQVVNVSYELPKSFVAAAPPAHKRLAAPGRNGPGRRFYIGQISAPTLKRRVETQQGIKKISIFNYYI
jgi:hypothetical protein